jgi:colanic acid biosynthesis glycosyl transferase WcaI
LFRYGLETILTPKGNGLRILFLTQIFTPEPAVKGVEFVKVLQTAGHHVKVATCFPSYPGGKIYPGYRVKFWQHETIDGVDVTRLANWPSHDMSGLRRAIHFLSFSFSALVYVLLNGRKYDLVYVGHPGITTGFSALLGGWVWRLPYVVEIQDLWPDSLSTSSVVGASRWAKIAAPICNLVYRRSLYVVAQSGAMGAVIAARADVKDKIRVIYNWAVGVPTEPLSDDVKPDGPFPIVYAGNIGTMQSLHTAIEAAVIAAKSEPRVELWLIGGGVDKTRLQAVAEKFNAENVCFLPRVPDAELNAKLSKAGAFLLHLAKTNLVEFTIPSKSQFYLALGKPILAAVSGEVGRIMRDSGAAIVVQPEDPQAMAEAMVKLARLSKDKRLVLGANGKRTYVERFSFEHALTQTIGLLREVATSITKTS